MYLTVWVIFRKAAGVKKKAGIFWPSYVHQWKYFVSTKTPQTSLDKACMYVGLYICSERSNEIQYWSKRNRLYTSFMLFINHTLPSFLKLFAVEQRSKGKKTNHNYFEEIVLKPFPSVFFSRCKKLICQRQCPSNELLNLKLIGVVWVEMKGNLFLSRAQSLGYVKHHTLPINRKIFHSVFTLGWICV